jgi:DNA-binding beta-propeller fold protein YncE
VGTAARLNHPTSICKDKNGVVYAVEEVTGHVRKILPDGTVSTLPGTFNMPTGVAVDANGLVYIAEQNGNTIRTIALNGGAAVLAGSGAWGFKDATGSEAQFDTPHGLLLDAQNRLYVADMDNHRIRRVE